MINHDRVPDGQELGRPRIALLGVTLGFAGATAIAAIGSVGGAGNQAAAALVAAVSLSGCAACVTGLLHTTTSQPKGRPGVTEMVPARRIARAYKLDVFNVRSTMA